jgi:hypothetical protein
MAASLHDTLLQWIRSATSDLGVSISLGHDAIEDELSRAGRTCEGEHYLRWGQLDYGADLNEDCDNITYTLVGIWKNQAGDASRRVTDESCRRKTAAVRRRLAAHPLPEGIYYALLGPSDKTDEFGLTVVTTEIKLQYRRTDYG